MFKISESGNREVFLQAVWRFVLFLGVAPVAFLTLPIELQTLGILDGLMAAVLCLLPSLIVMEFLLLQSQRIPFTSSYLPGEQPLIQTVLIYSVSVGLYVSALSGIIAVSLNSRRATLILLGLMVAAWLRIRKARLEDWKVIGKLEFEEVPEPAVMRLCIERD